MGKLTGTPPSGPKKAADSKRPAQAERAPVAPSSHAVRSPKILSGAPQASQQAAGKAPAAPAAKSPSSNVSKKAAPKKNDVKKRAILATLGAGLLVFAMLKFQSEGGDTGAGASFATRQPTEIDESMRVFTPLGEDTLWSNPEQGIIQRNFCRGNQNSAGCSHAPLHPFSEEFTKAGWSEKEYAKYLGWDKYPREDQNRVISETVTYENKAFKFR